MKDTFTNIVNDLVKQITALSIEKDRVFVALDGRSASGKTTTANAVAEKLRDSISCEVIPMDDFFLRPEQRTKERLLEPGGNVDAERFKEEVLKPLKEGMAFSYRPFDCHTQSLAEPVFVKACRVVLIEGAYSCRPDLWNSYDYHIFFDVDRRKQMERITARNGAEGAKCFEERWIPLEEKYLAAYGIQKKCELCCEIL